MFNENKGADQLRGYREADLRLCFRICRLLVFPWGGSNNKTGHKWIVVMIMPVILIMSRLVGKPTICICENKDAD